MQIKKKTRNNKRIWYNTNDFAILGNQYKFTEKSEGNVFMGNESAVRLWNTFTRDKSDIPDQFDGVWQLGDSEEYTRWVNTLILSGLKTVFSYPLEVWQRTKGNIPKEEDYYVLLDSQDSAVAIVQILNVHVCPFDELSEDYVSKAGEGDRSKETWSENHKPFFRRVLEEQDMEFSTKIDLLCIEFELIFAA